MYQTRFCLFPIRDGPAPNPPFPRPALPPSIPPSPLTPFPDFAKLHAPEMGMQTVPSLNLVYTKQEVFRMVRVGT